jgi:ACS family hexuronate transporter-like MFS transporter
MDRLGTRRGFAAAVALWSLAAIAHAAAFSAVTFGAARALLGLGESASFPASNKSVAEWFPKKERALAFGLFNSGANIGAVIVPLTVPWLALTFGWRAAFIATGALGFVWLVFWWLLYAKPTEHPAVSPAELALIQSDPPDKVQSLPWSRLLPKRETWAYAMGKFLTDPIWWFYLFWFPRYLQETFGLSMQQIVWPTVIVYNICTIGSVGGGWLSTSLINRGWSINAARKTAMLICALSVAPVVYAPYAKSVWTVVALIGLATAAHQGWSCNLFTLVSDMFPRSAVGSVTGIGGTAGAVASVLMQVATGYIVQLTHSYLPLFIVAASGYVVALAVVHTLSPKLAPAELD